MKIIMTDTFNRQHTVIAHAMRMTRKLIIAVDDQGKDQIMGEQGQGI